MDHYFIFAKTRDAASRKNKNLCSREKAAKALGISPMSLNNYETGVTAPPPRVVSKMAEVYNAPELKYFYCRNMCDINASLIPDVEADTNKLDVGRLTLRLLKSLKNITNIKESLIDIAEDGTVNEAEKESFREILDELTVIVKHALELRLWAEKVMKM
jgi:transcriptional regulator with XRE-family HTH domain